MALDLNNSNRNRSSKKQADGFLNFSIPGSDGNPMKIGFSALDADKPRDAQLIAFCKQNPEAAAKWLAENMVVSYQDARESELALPTLGQAAS